MHLFACEHLKKVHNPYTDSDLFVPCGECDICRSKRSLSWTERLEIERSQHPYCLFGTLTYSDEFLPKFALSDVGFVDETTGELVPYSDISYEYLDNNSLDFIGCRGYLPVGSVFDCQRFIKRLRSRVLSNSSNTSGENRKCRYIRYFLVCEMGETTFRPHYHFIIFTGSKWFADNAKSVVSSCWTTDLRCSDSKQLGRIDVQNVQSSATSYVSGYLNSFVSAPKIYRYKRFKGFALFSKSPSIGSLLSNSKEIQTLFDSGDCEMFVYRRKTNEYVRVPVSKSLSDRLYPKIFGFSTLSDDVIPGVYCLADNGPWLSFGYFEQFIRERAFRTYDGVSEYLRKILNNLTESKSCLHRLYTVLNRIIVQCVLFGSDKPLSSAFYAKKIISFYQNVDYNCLKSQLECEVELSEKHGSKSCLLTDLVFVDNLSMSGVWTPNEIRLIKSYCANDIQLSKCDFLSDLDFSQISDFINLRSKCSKIVNEHRKKVAKTEFLEHRTKDKLFINFLKTYHGL